jgi:hypothetical protein
MRLAFRCASRVPLVALCFGVVQACSSEPPPSAIETALKQGAPRAWPLPLSPLRAARQACRTDFCLAADALELVLNRAAQWLAAYDEELRFDAAVNLSQIRRIVGSPDLERAWTTAAAAANHDPEHPLRRFWLPDFRAPLEHTARWPVPIGGERVSSDRVLTEALHCKDNGWRSETTAYVCGPMRDGGGDQSVDALWALTLARERGCLDELVRGCLQQIQEEIARVQPGVFEPRKTLDFEIYARRLLTLLLSGYDKPDVHTWARRLIELQGGGGNWAVGIEEDRYDRYRATSAATWALAEWLRFLAVHPGQALPLGAFRVHAPFPIGGAAFWGCSLP